MLKSPEIVTSPLNLSLMNLKLSVLLRISYSLEAYILLQGSYDSHSVFQSFNFYP